MSKLTRFFSFLSGFVVKSGSVLLRFTFIPLSDLLHTLFFAPEEHPRPESNSFEWLRPLVEGPAGRAEAAREPGLSWEGAMLKAFVGNCEVRHGRD